MAKPEPKHEPKPVELTGTEKAIQECLGKAAPAVDPKKPREETTDKAPADLKTKLSPDEYSEYLTLLGKMRGPKGAALAGKDKERWESLLKKAGVLDGKTIGGIATEVKLIETPFSREAALKTVESRWQDLDPKLKNASPPSREELRKFHCSDKPESKPLCAQKKDDLDIRR